MTVTSPPLHLTDELLLTTARIEAHRKGTRATGTGFFFEFAARNGGLHVPALVTNRHVVEGFDEVRIPMSFSDAAGARLKALPEWINIPLDPLRRFFHPDPTVDLAAITLAPNLIEMEAAGKSPYFRRLAMSQLLTDDQAKDLLGIEDILMVGYPNGIWDKVNNRPVVRRGLTASPLGDDWNGRPEFMIDAACFPGSSGSPVFLFNQGAFATRGGATKVGTRFWLVGILFAGPQYTVEGEIKVKDVPTLAKDVSLTAMPINLGVCIKAKQLTALDHLFQKRMPMDEGEAASAPGPPA